MKKTNIFILALLIAAAFSVVVYSAEAQPMQVILGERYTDAVHQADTKKDEIAAAYKGEPVMMSVVEYQQKTAVFRDESSSQREIIDGIITSMIMVDEAEKRGLAVTEEEINAFVDETVYAAYQTAEGKELIDSYCASAGLTFEEYVQSVREQAPEIIAKAKLEKAIAQEYCNAHGIDFDELNPTEEVKDAIDTYRSDLLETHRDDIVYYTE